MNLATSTIRVGRAVFVSALSKVMGVSLMQRCPILRSYGEPPPVFIPIPNEWLVNDPFDGVNLVRCPKCGYAYKSDNKWVCAGLDGENCEVAKAQNERA